MEMYKWEVKKDGLYLHQQNGNFSPENLKQGLDLLLEELKLRQIKYEQEKIKAWFFQKNNQPIKIIDSNNVFNDQSIMEVKISEDQLKAYITIIPSINREKYLTLLQIKNYLNKIGVVKGIDEVKIITAVAQKDYVIDLLVAEGIKPQNGRNANIKYHFLTKGIEIKPKELEDGKVDFYNINLIQNVNKDQLLVEKIPATKGISGVTVTGKEIPAADGNDTILPIGRNLYPSNDNLKGYSACEGHVVITERRVSVLSVLEIKSNVDFSTGNIDFVGNIVIKGNINDGFTVKANGDVEVYGTVEGGNIYASGNILIRKGIRGLQKSNIEAKGCVYSNFIEHATISAGEDIVVGEAIMHSVVNSGANIAVGGRKGLVVGGIIRSGKSLECKNIGSSLATITKIDVGIQPELRIQYKEVQRKMIENRENMNKSTKALKILNEIKNKLGNLPSDKKEMYIKLSETKKTLNMQQEDLFLIRKELEEKINESENGFVKVSDRINCGVNISIGKANKHFTNERKSVILKQKQLDISILPIKDDNDER